MPQLERAVLVFLIVVLSVGCATEEPVKANRPASQTAFVRPSGFEASSQSRKGGAEASGMGSQVLPQSTASPYLFISPWLGTWRFREDPSFTMTLDERGRVTYGPFFAGAYKFLEQGRFIQFDLTGIAGQFKDQKLAPLVLSIEYLNNGQVIVLRNGASVVVMEKVK